MTVLDMCCIECGGETKMEPGIKGEGSMYRFRFSCTECEYSFPYGEHESEVAAASMAVINVAKVIQLTKEKADE